MTETPVEILIRSVQTLDGQSETIDLNARGTLRELSPDGEGFLLTYREGEPGGEQTETVLTVEVDRITLRRTGEVGCEMVFQPGLRHRSQYRTPYGAFPVTVTTGTALALLGPDGGRIQLEYGLEMAGQDAGVTRFTLAARPIA